MIDASAESPVHETKRNNRKAASMSSGKTPRSYLLLSLLVALLFAVYALAYTEGRPCPPLDDSFIHYQYAKMIAEGHPFSYNPLDGYTKGATSFLYPILLAPFYLAGCKGLWIFLPAFLIGVISLWLCAVFMRRLLVGTGVDEESSAVAGFLLILNGPLLWGFLSGMEIGLFCALLTGFLYYAAEEKPGRICLTGVLLCLTRPEGAIAVAVVWLVKAAVRRRFPGFALTIPLFAALVPSAIHLIMTGDPRQNGLVAKSYLWRSEAYTFPWVELLATSASRFTRALHEGLSGQFCGYLPVVPMALALLGLFWTVRSAAASAGVQTLLVFLGLVVVPSVVLQGWWHHYRYLMPAATLLVALIGIGIHVVRTYTSTGLARGCAAVLLAASAFQLPYWAYTYGNNAREIQAQDITAANWLLNEGRRYRSPAIFDAGTIPYLSGRRCFDLLGLTTEGVVHWAREGEGSVFEKLERLQEKPDLLIVHDHWFADLWNVVAGEELARFVVPQPEIVTTGTVRVRRFDDSLLNSGNEPLGLQSLNGYELVDELDVADIESEHAHNYRIESAYPDYPPSSVVGVFTVGEHTIADGGRAIVGSQSFDVRLKDCGEFLLVVRANRAAGYVVEVSCDGVPVTGVEAPPTDGLVEISCVVTPPPGADLTTRITLSPRREKQLFRPFEVYHYWVYQ